MRDPDRFRYLHVVIERCRMQGPGFGIAFGVLGDAMLE
jgi:hypothetical protein